MNAQRHPATRRAQVLKTDAIKRRLQHHAKNCTYFIFSGDRHCSCGRDLALVQLAALEARAKEFSNSDFANLSVPKTGNQMSYKKKLAKLENRARSGQGKHDRK